MPEWGIAIISMVVGTLLGFILNLWRDNHQKNKKRRQEALEIHFHDINEMIIHRMSEMARNLQMRNNRLVFGSYAPVQEKYNFEEEEEYKGFEIHFPKLAKEWKQLFNNALRMNEELVNGHEINIVPLQQDFENYAKRLTNTANRVERYGIGTEFRHNKDCPICKNF